MLSMPDPIIADRISDELHRIYPNMTNRDIANSIGIDRKVISRLYSGSVPSAPNLCIMAQNGLDLNYCFTGKRGDTK